ncbi:hypothetical protein [Salinibacter ruber]|uniref:hypothetical protein n=1 Tax=Salinibacter ruber TaxID=146919 RepID=UPI002168F865|nr:hypothetical protein [Salinibacter ruber]
MEQIRQAEPQQLFIGADGPRAGHPEEAERCKRAREVATRVDWDCEVHTLFRDENLGCGEAVSSAITWFFEHVEKGIILEDDCVPNPSFFPFCQKILKRYADTPQIMHINGNTYGLDQRGLHDYSYGFGNYPQVWGWATWRGAWEKYDFEINAWPAFRDAGMVSQLDGGGRCSDERIRKWNKVHSTCDLDTWDYQWHFEVMRRSGLAVVPEVNLVSNIGFGEKATHTNQRNGNKESIDTRQVSFPLSHPPFRVADRRINNVYRKNMVEESTINKIKRRAKKILQIKK